MEISAQKKIGNGWEKRLTSGIPGLDVICEGGLIRDHTYLLVGSPGTGKTLFSLQWLLEGTKLGENCLYITLAEKKEEIERNISNFEWNIENIQFLDLSPTQEIDFSHFQEYQVFSPCEVEQLVVWEKIITSINELNPNRVVIDSATQLRYLSHDEYQFRKHILNLVIFLNSKKITSLLLFEPTELEHEVSVSLAVDGIIRLKIEESVSNIMHLRGLQVEKFRGSNFLSGLHPLCIDKNGIHIFPHIIEKIGENTPGERTLPSGIKLLDELLSGGVESGTTTLLTGPSGVGKTSLGTNFLTNLALNGYKSILFTFEESFSSVITRAKKMKVPVDKALKKGTFEIKRINPMEIFPDQFLEIVRHKVEKEGFNVLMLDSIRGYQIAMEEYGTLLGHLNNLVNYLNRKEVTTFLINEVEAITGDLKVTELGVSHLADNVLLLRYAECKGEVIKLVCCLKKRLGDFESQLRKISFTKQGIDVGEQLQMQGILTGTPSFISP